MILPPRSVQLVRYRLPQRVAAGQSTAEYALLLALVAVSAILILTVLGADVQSMYCTVVGIFGAGPEECAIGLLWEDAMDNFDLWDLARGRDWESRDGQGCVDGGGEHRGFAGDETWDDYTVEVGGAEMSKGRGYGVYFRTTNPTAPDGYVFQYDRGYYSSGAFLIRPVSGGRELPPIKAVHAPDDFEWYGTSRDISIRVEGDTFTASVDGNEVLRVQDSRYPEGQIGLRSWGGSRVCFDHVAVTK